MAGSGLEGFAYRAHPVLWSVVQRLFSSFPEGAPGCGLLLLRVAAGLVAVTHGIASLSNPDERPAFLWIGELIASAGGLSLLLGLLTPVAGGLVALSSLAVALGLLRPGMSVLGDPVASFLVIVALAIVLLGPGAYSLDAYFFGRREIVIPDPIARKE